MSRARRIQFFSVLLLMFGGAIAELGTIGAVIPFLALLEAKNGTQHHWLHRLVGFHSLAGAASIFVLFAVTAGLIRLQLAKSSRSFIFRLGHELTVEIERRVLLQPFSFHIHRNTSTLVTALHKTEALVGDLLLPLMLAFTGGTIALCVVALLVLVEPFTTLSVAAALAITYALISIVTRHRLTASSAVMKNAYDQRIQVVHESLDGIRDVIIDGSQRMYLREFARIDSALADARALTQFIYLGPRYLIEMVGMIVIAVIALAIGSRSGGLAAAVPILGALALGAQRLLPLLQDVYRGWSSAAGERSIFEQIVELLSLPVHEQAPSIVEPLRFDRAIELENVSFAYPTRIEAALENVSLTIPCGTMLAVVGRTGSGKSTLADVLMGLLAPTNGQVLIDDRPLAEAAQERWHRSVAHVPQSIFLSDSTIERNIALSLPDAPLDRNRIIESAKKAALHEFIISLPDGYETYVGERGIRLSGGQRQRLGIARAIYKNAPVLVLDEATSALDDLTEAAVIAALEELRRKGRTIIVVAHRQSTVRQCDALVRLDQGHVVEIRSLHETAASQRRHS
jgi:ATP-binding cassette subfamily B protein